MIGAIIGDIIGSTYEFIDNVKDKDFDLFVSHSMVLCLLQWDKP